MLVWAHVRIRSASETFDRVYARSQFYCERNHKTYFVQTIYRFAINSCYGESAQFRISPHSALSKYLITVFIIYQLVIFFQHIKIFSFQTVVPQYKNIAFFHVIGNNSQGLLRLDVMWLQSQHRLETNHLT